MRFERRLRAMLGRLPVCLAIGLSVSNAASAFEPGDVFWVSGVCGTPCGVFDITAGGTIGAGDLVAAMQESPGQVAWSSDRQTLYVSEFGTDAILAISGSGAVTLFGYFDDGTAALTDGTVWSPLMRVSTLYRAFSPAKEGGRLPSTIT